MVVSAIFVAAILTFALAPIASAAGAGNALDFDGENEYVDVGTVSTDFTGGITIEAYAYYDAFGFWSRIVDFGQGQGANNILFTNYATTSNLVYEVYKGNGQTGGKVIASGALDLNHWMHLTATEDNAGNVKIYKNGIEVALGRVDVPANVSRTNSYIAKSNWGADKYFNGKIDEVRIWNVVRTEDEIRANMCKTLAGNENGLVAYYRFDQSSGTTLPDLTSNDNNGTLTSMEDGDWVTSTAAIGDKSHYGTGTSNLTENIDVPVNITWDGDNPGTDAIFDAIQNDAAPDVYLTPP